MIPTALEDEDEDHELSPAWVIYELNFKVAESWECGSMIASRMCKFLGSISGTAKTEQNPDTSVAAFLNLDSVSFSFVSYLFS